MAFGGKMTCNCARCRGEGPPDDEAQDPPDWFVRKMKRQDSDLCDDEIMQEWVKNLERQR
jgi:hypothetical protein